MFTSALPLLTRALRLDARLWRAHVFRLLFVGLIALFVLNAQMMSLVLGAPGLQVFRSIAWLNLVAVTLAGVSFFATAITEEREEETLGLLRLAGINPLTLLLGKSTSRLISALLLLLVQLPFTLLAITLGGVTLGQIHAAYWALGAYLVLAANVGLFCSVVCKRSGNATGMTGFLLALYLFGPWIVLAIFGLTPGAAPAIPNNVPPWLARLAEGGVVVLNRAYDASIVHRLGTIMGTGFNESPFSWQVGSNLAGALVCFGVAWGLFDVFTRDRLFAFPSRRVRLARARGRLLAPGRAWSNPFVWKDFYFGAGGRRMIAAKFVLYGLLAAGIAAMLWLDDPTWLQHVDDTIIGIGLAGAAIELCLYAANVFRDEIHGQTFPSLAILPVPLGRIAYSKAAGFLIALVPALCYAILGLALTEDGLLFSLLQVLLEPGVWTGLLGFVLFVHAVALCSLFVRWGALPLAIFLTFILGYCLLGPIIGLVALVLMAVSGGEEELAFVAIALAEVALIVGLQASIYQRLKAATAQ